MQVLEQFQNTSEKLEAARNALTVADAELAKLQAVADASLAKKNALAERVEKDIQLVAQIKKSLAQSVANGDDISGATGKLTAQQHVVEACKSALESVTADTARLEREITNKKAHSHSDATRGVEQAEYCHLLARYAKAAGPLLTLAREIRLKATANNLSINELSDGLLGIRGFYRIGNYKLTESGELVSA